MRISEHPILDPLEKRKKININVNGRKIDAYEGETIASAICASGIKILKKSKKYREPRGVYCYRGRCTDCMMRVNGKPNVRTCITEVKNGMIVETPDKEN